MVPSASTERTCECFHSLASDSRHHHRAAASVMVILGEQLELYERGLKDFLPLLLFGDAGVYKSLPRGENGTNLTLNMRGKLLLF